VATLIDVAAVMLGVSVAMLFGLRLVPDPAYTPAAWLVVIVLLGFCWLAITKHR